MGSHETRRSVLTDPGPFLPIRTDRLTVRLPRMSDAEPIAAWRSDPRVAHFQAWTPPFPLDSARSMVDDAIAKGRPTDGNWWTAIVDTNDTETPIGEIVVQLTWGGRTAEVGYTFAQHAWGHGYAVEALEAVVEYLFEGRWVHRVFGQLHPDNRASAQVLERCGLLFEGHTRGSFWEGDEVSDDWIYGMLRQDWDQWRNRPVGPPSTIRLVEINRDNYGAVRSLVTHRSQEAFVAPVARSFHAYLFPGDVDGDDIRPWMRAIEADGELVGFVMLGTFETHRHPFLWRFLIDRHHQRRGIGRRVLDMLVTDLQGNGETVLLTSWHPGRGSPGPFYLAYGFEPTGRNHGDEIEGRITLVG